MIPAWAFDEFGEDAFLTEFPVILSVTRLPQKMSEVPASVTVIDRDMIDASGAIEIADLFRLVPGFQVGHYHDTDGSRTNVSYRGLSDQYSRRMQVMIDGRSVYQPAIGGVNWNDLPIELSEIERIEVVRGSNSVTHGMNAFQGVINIITFNANETHGSQLTAISSNHGYKQTTYRVGGGTGDLNYRLMVDSQSSDGFDDWVNYDGEYFELNDSSQTYRLNLRTDYSLGINDSLTFMIGGAKGPREAGFDMDLVWDRTHTKQMTSDYQQLKYKHIISTDQEVNVQYYHNRSDIDARFNGGLISEIITELGMPVNSAWVLAVLGYVDHPYARDISLFNDRNDLEITHQFKLTDELRVVWGGEYRIDKFRGNDWVNSPETFQNRSQRIFFNGEWKPDEHWIVNIGDMAEKSDSIGLSHSPRLALNYDMGDGRYIRGAMSRAWRAPTFIENEFGYYAHIKNLISIPLYVSQGGLKPERMNSVELATGGQLASNSLDYEIRIFRDLMRDLIAVSTNKDSNITEVINSGEADIEGVEFQLKWHPRKRMLVHLGYSYYETKGYLTNYHEPSTFSVSNYNLDDFVTGSTVSLLLSQKLTNRLLLGFNYYMTQPTAYVAGDEVDAIETLDLKLSYAFTISGDKPSTLFVTGRNMLGEFSDFEKETISKPEIFVGFKVNL